RLPDAHAGRRGPLSYLSALRARVRDRHPLGRSRPRDRLARASLRHNLRARRRLAAPGQLRARHMLIISPTAKVSALADIEDSTRGTRIVIEDGVVIDAFVKIKPAGGTGDVIIGAGSFINSGCVLYTGHGIRIGKSVLIASNCTLAPTNHEFKDRSRLI